MSSALYLFVPFEQWGTFTALNFSAAGSSNYCRGVPCCSFHASRIVGCGFCAGWVCAGRVSASLRFFPNKSTIRVSLFTYEGKVFCRASLTGVVRGVTVVPAAVVPAAAIIKIAVPATVVQHCFVCAPKHKRVPACSPVPPFSQPKRNLHAVSTVSKVCFYPGAAGGKVFLHCQPTL